MKTFSLGFILAFIASALFQHINITTVKEFFESMIVILPLMLLLIFICWQGIKLSYVYFTYKKFKKRFPSSESNWECLLIDGVWGSGKTTHYKRYYQYIDDKPNIYISCFSASRSELIAQIIQQQFWCKLLTLNGLLAKIMESNWQIFMPKNRVVVFDDLERLHASQDNYLDLIGIVDYLKTTNKCQVILIADISKTPQIFNCYLERIVDEILDWQPCKINELLPEDSTIFTQQLANYLAYHSSSGFLENRRIIKNILLQINDWALSEELLRKNDKFYSSMIVGQIKQNISFLIKWHYLYFNDNAFFVNLANKAHNEFMMYKLGRIKKLHPSVISSKKEHDVAQHFYQDAKYSPSQIIPPDSAYDFGVHYFSENTQSECKKYAINDVEIRFFMQIYQICTNKNPRQLEREFYQRIGSGNLHAKNKITFKVGDVLGYIINTNSSKPFDINAILLLTSGLESLLSLVTNSNFERPNKFWYLPNNEYQNIYYPRQAEECQELVNDIISYPEVCKAIQQYKEYLRTKFQQFHNIEELQTKLLNSPDHSFIILGILYFVDSDVYKSIIKRRSRQIKQYVDNREPWLNENLRIYFNRNDNILLWCFNGANSDIATDISQVYTTILNDVGLSDVNNK